MSKIFFYGGILVMAVTLIIGMIVGIIFYFKRKMLKQKLDEEYGKLIK